jgi:hypothetical protein
VFADPGELTLGQWVDGQPVQAAGECLGGTHIPIIMGG